MGVYDTYDEKATVGIRLWDHKEEIESIKYLVVGEDVSLNGSPILHLENLNGGKVDVFGAYPRQVAACLKQWGKDTPSWGMVLLTRAKNGQIVLTPAGEKPYTVEAVSAT